MNVKKEIEKIVKYVSKSKSAKKKNPPKKKKSKSGSKGARALKLAKKIYNSSNYSWSKAMKLAWEEIS